MEVPERLGHVLRMTRERTSPGVEGDLEKIMRIGRGKRDLILVVAVAVLAVVIGAVWFGFRGSQVSRSSAAMTVPIPPSGTNVVPRSTTP